MFSWEPNVSRIFMSWSIYIKKTVYYIRFLDFALFNDDSFKAE